MNKDIVTVSQSHVPQNWCEAVKSRDYLITFFWFFFVLQPLPGEVERNLWSSVSTVKQLISKTIEVYGLTNLTEEEVSKHGVVIFKVPSLHQEWNFASDQPWKIINNTSTRLKKMKLNRTQDWIDRLLLRVAYFARTWPPRDLCILVWTGLNSFSRDKQKVKSRRTDERRLDFGLKTMRIQARSRLLCKILL